MAQGPEIKDTGASLKEIDVLMPPLRRMHSAVAKEVHCGV